MYGCPNFKRRCGKRSYSDKEIWSLLSTSLEKKKANKRKRDPDMLRDAVLELTVQRLNEEIMERCMRKVKRRRIDDSYEWRECANGLGWNMTASYQDDEDLLGIDDFFRRIGCSKRQNYRSSDMSRGGSDSLTKSHEMGTYGSERTKETTCRSEVVEDSPVSLTVNKSCVC